MAAVKEDNKAAICSIPPVGVMLEQGEYISKEDLKKILEAQEHTKPRKFFGDIARDLKIDITEPMKKALTDQAMLRVNAVEKDATAFSSGTNLDFSTLPAFWTGPLKVNSATPNPSISDSAIGASNIAQHILIFARDDKELLSQVTPGIKAACNIVGAAFAGTYNAEMDSWNNELQKAFITAATGKVPVGVIEAFVQARFAEINQGFEAVKSTAAAQVNSSVENAAAAGPVAMAQPQSPRRV